MIMGRIEESGKEMNLTELDSGVACSVCLDLVINGGGRSCAKLQCGHEFHLDCIGSAFNMKGTMQCPNCRKVEEGQWLFASGPTSSPPEISMGVDDGNAESYLFLLNFAEMPYRVQICPFRGLPQVHPTTESSLGMMSTMTQILNHQHPGVISPLSNGRLHIHQAPFQPHHLLAPPPLPLPLPMPIPIPMPITNNGGIFDTQRSLPRFIPPRQLVYDPSNGFPVYGEATNYSHAWVRDNRPHFPSP